MTIVMERIKHEKKTTTSPAAPTFLLCVAELVLAD
jgi:hypothetical protein